MKTQAAMKLRTEVCARCGKRWNVSITAGHAPGGYICPHCISRERWPLGGRSERKADYEARYKLCAGNR